MWRRHECGLDVSHRGVTKVIVGYVALRHDRAVRLINAVVDYK